MGKMPIGLQLYSVRHEFEKDPAGVLKAVAKMGYDGVEFAGDFQKPPAELRALLDENGLVCCGWHIPYARVQDDKLQESIATMKTLGCAYAIVPWIPATSRAEWLKAATFFNLLVEKLAPHGIVVGYHNHDKEFQLAEGGMPFDFFFGNTRPEVSIQLDTGNAMSGGAEAIPLLKRYPGRSKTVHLKPYSAELAKESPEAGFRPLIGEDSTPWKELLELCATEAGTLWYIIEYESDAYPAMEAVDKCLAALKVLLSE